MPELPEVEALVRFLDEHTRGHRIDRAQSLSIAALKTYDPPLEALNGAEVNGWSRRGKFLVAGVGDLFLVMHLARAGWVRWRDDIPPGPARPAKTPIAFRLRLEDGSGFDVTEMGKEKRLAIYVVKEPGQVEGIARLGIDPLDAAFDADRLAAILRDNKGHVKNVLTDQALIAGVGNAYSDEALHLARLSPFKSATGLSPDEVERLYKALIAVLTDAAARSEGLPAAGLKKEKRSGMRVHGRTGEQCPVCEDTIREVSFATKSLQYCATCQTGGKALADRRLSRLLK